MHFLATSRQWLVALLLWLIFDGLLLAQSNLGAARSLELTALTRAQQGRAQAGKMLALVARVHNSGDSPVQAELVGRVEGQVGEEDRRRIEVLPGREQAYELNVRVLPTYNKKFVEAIVTLNVIENGREIMVLRGDNPVSQSVLTDVLNDSSRTAIALDREPQEQLAWRWPPTEIYGTYEMVMATRVDSSLSRACLTLDSFPLPIHLSDWKGIDLLVISEPNVLKDSSSVSAIQQFLHTGGRVWIMLDKVDSALLEPLLEVHQQCLTVESLQSNHFVFETTGANQYAIEDRVFDSDNPVQIKRVLQEGGRVAHRVDGWPASIWFPVGRGELLVTTVESRGWLIPRVKNRTSDPIFSSTYGLPIWGGAFANAIHQSKPEMMLESKEPEYPLAQIGNPTVPRGLVTGVLAGFCGLLAAVGAWRWLAGELRWMGLLAPLLAVAASVPLVIAAVAQRREMPDMVSILQIADYGPNGTGVLREQAAVYSSSSRNMELMGQADGYALPSSKIESGVRKLVTEGFGKWRLINDAWPPGTWRYTTEITAAEGPYLAQGRLTSQGLTVEAPANFTENIEDAVIGYAPGAPSIGRSLSGKNSWLVDGTLPASGDRWTAESFVTEEQLRRGTIYREVFNVAGSNRLPPSRSLLGWTSLQKQGSQWNVDLERRGAALVAMPISLATPEVGTEVLVPYNMIRIEPPASGASSIYNATAARWIDESNLDTQAVVVFVLPPEVVPLQVTSVDIDWDIKAPKRTARLFWAQDGKQIDLAVLNEPSIPWSSRIENPELLRDLGDGRVELHIDVTGHGNQSQDNFVGWQLKHLRLSVRGKTLPRSSLASAPE